MRTEVWNMSDKSKQVDVKGRAEPQRAGLLAPAGRPRTSGRHQIDMGRYRIYQGETMVGEVYVECGSEPTCTIEHWCLYNTFRAPSREGTMTSIEFRFESGPYSAQDIQGEAARSGGRYIKALCEEVAAT
jgi:hypothetical protein